MLHRYWKYGEEDRWGKRKSPSSVFENRVGQFLKHAAIRHRNRGGLLKRAIGFDVIGNDGGQWTLRPDANQRPMLCEGIHPSCTTLVRVPSPQLEKFARMEGGELARQLLELARYIRIGEPQTALAELAAFLLPDIPWKGSIGSSRSSHSTSPERVLPVEQLDEQGDRTTDLQRLA
jgi:hypothetical protein